MKLETLLLRGLTRDAVYQVVKHGGRAEYDAMKKIYAKPRAPSTRTAAALVQNGLAILRNG